MAAVNSLAIRVAAAIVVVALAASAFLYVRTLRHDLASAQERASTLQEANRQAGEAYRALQLEKARVDGQLAERERFQQDLAKSRGEFNEAVRKLLETDKAVFAWSQQRVPAAMADGLRERAAVRGNKNRASKAAGRAAAGLPGAAVP